MPVFKTYLISFSPLFSSLQQGTQQVDQADSYQDNLQSRYRLVDDDNADQTSLQSRSRLADDDFVEGDNMVDSADQNALGMYKVYVQSV